MAEFGSKKELSCSMSLNEASLGSRFQGTESDLSVFKEDRHRLTIRPRISKRRTTPLSRRLLPPVRLLELSTLPYYRRCQDENVADIRLNPKKTRVRQVD